MRSTLSLFFVLCVLVMSCFAQRATNWASIYDGHYNYIVVGGGNSGAMVTARLVDAGFKVLLLTEGTDYTGPFNQAVYFHPVDNVAIDHPQLTKHLFSLGNPENLFTSQVIHIPNRPGGGSKINVGLTICPPFVDTDLMPGVFSNRTFVQQVCQEVFDNIPSTFFSPTQLLNNSMLAGAQLTGAPLVEDLDLSRGELGAGYNPRAIIFEPNNAARDAYDSDDSQNIVPERLVQNPLADYGFSNVVPKNIESMLAAENISIPQYTNQMRRSFELNSQYIRQDTYTKIIKPRLNNPNLTVRFMATALYLSGSGYCPEKIQGSDLCYDVVEYLHEGQLKRAHVQAYWRSPRMRNGEIILAAGALNSPRLLWHSGVGNCSVLNDVGLPCFVDNANVGNNLKEHMRCSLAAINPMGITPDLQQNRGALASVYYKGNPTLASPIDTEITMTNFEQAGMNIYLSIGVAVDSASEGYILPRNADPLELPLVQFNFYKDERDRITMAQSFLIQRQIALSQGLFEISPGFTTLPPTATLQDVMVYLAGRNTVADYHYYRTAVMGTNKLNAVVDSQFRVFDVANVRVIDNSVMPRITAHSTDGGAKFLGVAAGRFIVE